MPKVLVVDDNRDDLELYSEFLTGRGYDVVRAADGEAAVAAALREKPDFVIVDIVIPKLDGLGVISALRNYTPTMRIPIATISGQTGEAARAAALDAGADLALEKPCSPEDVEAAIRVFLMPGNPRRP